MRGDDPGEMRLSVRPRIPGAYSRHEAAIGFPMRTTPQQPYMTVLWILLTRLALLTSAAAVPTAEPGGSAAPLPGTGAPALASAHSGGDSAVKAAEETTLEQAMLSKLDAPLLFAKRHSYEGIHIYDTCYKWPGGGGGGLYLLENPASPRSEWKIRALIDATTPHTLGKGVYTHPDISPDASKVIFCYKNSADACTAIYEIQLDGSGLHQLTDPSDMVAKLPWREKRNARHFPDLSPRWPDRFSINSAARPGAMCQ